MGNSITCSCIDRQGHTTKKDVFAQYLQNDRLVQQRKNRKRSDSFSDCHSDLDINPSSAPALDKMRYWEDFSDFDAKQFAAILDAWDSISFALNLYFFEMAAEQHAAGMPHGKISLNGLSKVLAKFYSRYIDVHELSVPMLDPEVWRTITVKYEVAVARKFVDHETACELIRFFTKDLHMRLSSESIGQQVDAESEIEDANSNRAELGSPDSQSTMASGQDVLDSKGEAQAPTNILSRLPSPSRVKPVVPKLDIASLRAR